MSGNPTFMRRREERLRAEEFGRLQRRASRELADALALAWRTCNTSRTAQPFIDELGAEGALALGRHKAH